MVSKLAGRAVLLLLCLVVGDAVRQARLQKGDVVSAAQYEKQEHEQAGDEHVEEGHGEEVADSKLEWGTPGCFATMLTQQFAALRSRLWKLTAASHDGRQLFAKASLFSSAMLAVLPFLQRDPAAMSAALNLAQSSFVSCSQIQFEYEKQEHEQAGYEHVEEGHGEEAAVLTIAALLQKRKEWHRFAGTSMFCVRVWLHVLLLECAREPCLIAPALERWDAAVPVPAAAHSVSDRLTPLLKMASSTP
ncbi:unnamed protein product [Symbiodinium sp. CCMP2592]|nr:unnamed protein product [Symbiodinium sp. CCMP2592]